MPCILNTRTGLTHSVTRWMWEEIWKNRVEREPQNYKLVLSPVIRLNKPMLRAEKKLEIAQEKVKEQERQNPFDDSIPKEMTFEYIEEMVKKSREADANKKTVKEEPVVKKKRGRGRPPKRKRA